MIRNREEFVKALWEDYRSLPENKREESFIYTYFKRKKDNRARFFARNAQIFEEYRAQKKRDKYILLRSAYLAYVDEVISEEEYLTMLRELTSVKDKASGISKEKKKYEGLCGKEKISEAEKKLERKFLMGCVSDFFQNAGYRVNKSQDVEEHVKLPDKHRKEKDGYTDDLAMVYDFYQYQGMQKLQETYNPTDKAYINRLDEGHIEKCKELYQVLQKEKCYEAFVPLYVDVDTGAGVYIIGRNRYWQYTRTGRRHNKQEHMPQEKIDSCYACVIYFSAVLDDISEYAEMNLTMFVESYDTVEEAFYRFQAGVNNQEFYENYPMENEDALPEGIDNRFALYFVEKKMGQATQKEELIRQKIKAEQAKKERARYEQALLLERKSRERGEMGYEKD